MRITSSTENRMQAWTTTFWDWFLHSFMPHINTDCTLPPAMGQSVSSQDGQGRGLDTDLGPPRILSGTQIEICTMWCSLQQRGFSSLQLGGAGLVVREGFQRAQLCFWVLGSPNNDRNNDCFICHVIQFYPPDTPVKPASLSMKMHSV